MTRIKFLTIATIFVTSIYLVHLFWVKNEQQIQLQKKEREIALIEYKKIISDGVVNFLATTGVDHYWPGCNEPENISIFEIGYCDGYWLTEFPYEKIRYPSVWDKVTLGDSYSLLVTSENDGYEICKLAVNSANWGDHNPKYSVYPVNQEILKNVNFETDYIKGCKFGIKKHFSSGQEKLFNEEWRQKNNSYINPPSPEPSVDNQGGHWVTKCRQVLVRNPNYNGDQNGVSQNITNGPPNVFQQQCTDQYVK